MKKTAKPVSAGDASIAFYHIFLVERKTERGLMVPRSTLGTNFRASTALAENFEELNNQLKTTGWEYRPIVIYQGNDNPSSRFGAFVRDVPNPLAVTKGFVNHDENVVNIFSNETVTKKNERLTKTENPAIMRVQMG